MNVLTSFLYFLTMVNYSETFLDFIFNVKQQNEKIAALENIVQVNKNWDAPY